MTHNQQVAGLLGLLARAFVASGAHNSAVGLGDRSKYMGMSDVGRAIECPRWAVAGKVSPAKSIQPEEIKDLAKSGDIDSIVAVLDKHINLRRGHWIEAGVKEDLKVLSDTNLLHQLVIVTEYEGVPIQAHLDLTLIYAGSYPAIRILEVKAPKKHQSRLYTSHETQLYSQLGLTKREWNNPAFNLNLPDGTYKYERHLSLPELVKREFGLVLPIDPQKVDFAGWVIAVGPGSIRPYGPYRPHDDTLAVCFNVARETWHSTTEIRAGRMSLIDVSPCEGFYPLCDFCEFFISCPKFQCAELPEYENVLARRANIKEQIKALEEDCTELEDHLREVYARLTSSPNTGLTVGDWVIAGSLRFRVSKGRLWVGKVNRQPEDQFTLGERVQSKAA